MLAGCGYSNKQIARALGLTPRTVDCYLTEARRLFGAHDRTTLVVDAILAGEVGLHELKDRQPEYMPGLSGPQEDRKSVGAGKGGAGSVELGGGRHIKTKK